LQTSRGSRMLFMELHPNLKVVKVIANYIR
jgi:hypothetical protein